MSRIRGALCTVTKIPAIDDRTPASAEPVVDAAIEVIEVIEEMDHAAMARTAACGLKKDHPAVVFTGGRRVKRDQSRAMGCNGVKKRQWMAEPNTASD